MEENSRKKIKIKIKNKKNKKYIYNAKLAKNPFCIPL
jgi:hypothetical protein